MPPPARPRQRLRQACLLLALLLFPLTLNYFSPYLIIDGAFQGIISGSFIVFGLLFLSALFVGRLWCAWLCPAAGLQAACFAIQPKPARGGRLNWIKWGIWAVWISVIALGVISAGGYRAVDFFYLTEGGISVTRPEAYLIYYIVVGVFVLLALLTGRRGGCHYLCWMAPWMILGRKLRNLGRWPALHLTAEPDKCIDCQRCTKNCPMSLDVHALVRRGEMEDSECILCGNCIDVCPKDVLHYAFDRN